MDVVLKEEQAHELTDAGVLFHHPLLVVFVDLNLQREREIVVQCNHPMLGGRDPEVQLGHPAIQNVQHVIIVYVVENDVIERTRVDRQLRESGA